MNMMRYLRILIFIICASTSRAQPISAPRATYEVYFSSRDGAIAHNKVIMIDNSTVVTGSFNFTKAAEDRNAENLLLLQSRELAARYIDYWRIHQSHSTPFH